jgi:hypothetical protein
MNGRQVSSSGMPTTSNVHRRPPNGGFRGNDAGPDGYTAHDTRGRHPPAPRMFAAAVRVCLHGLYADDLRNVFLNDPLHAVREG